MKQITYKIKNTAGFHARPAALLVSAAMRFKSSVIVQKDEKKTNLKSLLGLLGLGVCRNDVILITAEGEDEADALNEIIGLIDSFEC